MRNTDENVEDNLTCDRLRHGFAVIGGNVLAAGPKILDGAATRCYDRNPLLSLRYPYLARWNLAVPMWLHLPRPCHENLQNMWSHSPGRAMHAVPHHDPIDVNLMRTNIAFLVELTAREPHLFHKLNAAGWLTTGQIRDYFFPGRSLNAVSKRLRKLVAAKYLSDAQVSSTATKFYRLAGRGKRFCSRFG